MDSFTIPFFAQAFGSSFFKNLEKVTALTPNNTQMQPPPLTHNVTYPYCIIDCVYGQYTYGDMNVGSTITSGDAIASFVIFVKKDMSFNSVTLHNAYISKTGNTISIGVRGSSGGWASCIIYEFSNL